MRLGSSIRRRRSGSGKRRKQSKKERASPPGDAKYLRLAGLGLAVALVSFGVGHTVATRLLFPVPSRPDNLVELPDVRGLAREEAVQAMEQVALSAIVADSFRHPTALSGSVLGQSPLAGQLSLPGDTVLLTLSLGPERRPVPDVIRLRERWARNVLEAGGFTVAVDSLEADMPVGRVFEIIPEPGTEVDLPMEVRIAVSMGPPLIPMPRLLGIEQAEAEAILDSLGFVVSEIVTRFRFGRDQGRVVEQDPPIDSLLERGSAVRLVVGRRSNRRRGGRNQLD